MTLEELIQSDQVAPPEVSQVFAGQGLLHQFLSQETLGKEEIRISYLRPSTYHNKNGAGIYYSIYQVVVDRNKKIIRWLEKDAQ
jgi:hypothetical protein